MESELAVLPINSWWCLANLALVWLQETDGVCYDQHPDGAGGRVSVGVISPPERGHCGGPTPPVWMTWEAANVAKTGKKKSHWSFECRGTHGYANRVLLLALLVALT